MINPDFEQFTLCPGAMSPNTIVYAVGWTTPTTSTDYFHTCATNYYYHVPTNHFGYQFPHSGQAYAGIIPYINQNQPYNPHRKEYLTTVLSAPLKKDSIYVIDFWWNTANETSFACNCLDVLLTDTMPTGVMVNPSTPGLINATPQLTKPSGTYLYDTVHWHNRCWLYTAAGGEQVMTIGSFTDNSVLDVIQVVDQYNDFYRYRSYYHIDDVSVVPYDASMFDTGLPQKIGICPDSGAVTLTAKGIFHSFQWNTGEQSATIQVTAPGLYKVTASHGCMTRVDSVEVIGYHKDFLPADTIFCKFEPFTLSLPIQQGSYQWSDGSVSPSLWVSAPGTYSVTLTGLCGELIDQLVVSEWSGINLIMPHDTVIELGQHVVGQPTLIASTNVDLQWWPTEGLSCSDCAAPTARPMWSTDYTLTVTNSSGCSTSGKWKVEVVNKRRVFVPNIFTPNYDGVNDILLVFVGIEVAQVLRFDVFDRWGNHVYHAAPLPTGFGWDGTFRGAPVPSGVYAYVVDVVYLDGTQERFVGDVFVQF